MMLRLLVMLMAKSGVITFTPLSLFANGEQGAWYDPSDLTTMFQDSAGTTPVTAAEQPVGLILDKSKGLVLGAELVVNGGFDSNIGWGLMPGWVVSSGELTISASAFTGALRGISLVAGRSYRISVQCKAFTSGDVRVQFLGGTTVNSTFRATSATTFTEVMTAISGNNQLIILSGASGFTGTIDNISVREIPGNHATQTTATKRPILKLIDGKYSLLFDGIDDALVTGSIDFTATDKMTVVAGVRKLSDAARGMIVELSAAYAAGGAFDLEGPGATLGNYVTAAAGTAAVAISAVRTAPQSNVLTQRVVISESMLELRINGEFAAGVANSLGTGNFGNYPLYIGSRAGTSLPFNGHLYSLLIRGAQSTDAQIISAETWVNSKTGAY